MSDPENPQNEQQSDSNPWTKNERRVNLEKKSECPALESMNKDIIQFSKGSIFKSAEPGDVRIG